MKLTRKVLSILLIVAMLSVYFVGSAVVTSAATDPIQVQTIDDTGALEGSKKALTGMLTNVNIDYLSDRTPVGSTGGNAEKTGYNTTYNNSNSLFFQRPNQAYTLSNSESQKSRTYSVLGQDRTFNYTSIYLGGYGTYYAKGLGVHPAGKDLTPRALIFTTEGKEYFYAVAGCTGTRICDLTANVDGQNYRVQFKLYGSKAETYSDGMAFELLAQSGELYNYLTAEFNINISGYNFIKLEVINLLDNNNCGVAWGNACVYDSTIQDNSFIYAPEGNAFAGMDIVDRAYLSDWATAEDTRFISVAGNTPTYDKPQNGKYCITTQSGVKTIDTTEGVEYDGVTYVNNQIYLGYNGQGPTYFAKGIGQLPAQYAWSYYPEKWGYLMFDVSGYDRFYSAVGLTSTAMDPENGNYGNGVYFEIYGSVDALTSDDGNDPSLVLLARSDAIRYGNSGEFNVDISDYKTLKLVIRIDDANQTKHHYSSTAAWGGACVYNLPEAAETNTRFSSSLSLIKGWNKSSFAKDPAKAVFSYKGNTISSGISQTGTLYTGELQGIAGKEMTEMVSVYLANANGQAVSETVTYSIRDYALEYLANGEDTTGKYKAVVYNMLQYGAAAQERFDYNVEALANAGTEGYSYPITLDNSNVADRTSVDTNGMFYATNLRLKEQVNLMFYFKVLPTDSYAVFTWGDGKTVTVNYADFMDSDANGVKIVELTELAAAEYKEAVTCTIYDANDQVLVSATDSVARYAFAAKEKNNASSAVCEALLAYSQAAAEYEAAKAAN